MPTSGKVSYVLTLQRNSLPLTDEMMTSIDMPVNEIVTTRDDVLMHTYIHLQRKTRKEDLERAIKSLSDKGVAWTNIPGHPEIEGTSRVSCEFIEDHPGFRTLVRHQAEGNANFHRWTAEDFVGTNAGYNKLKKKLLSSRTVAVSGEVNAKGIYVLRVDNRPKPFFYVGKANDIERRIQQHSDGTGAYCITGEPFTRVETVTKGTSFVLPKVFHHLIF